MLFFDKEMTEQQPTWSQNWKKWILNSMNKNLSEETRVKILEECGRTCHPPFLSDLARKIYEKTNDLDAFLEEFSKEYEGLLLDGDKIYVVYDKCVCPSIGDYPGDLSDFTDSYCYCSRGWVKELFERALLKPIEVDIINTVVRGSDHCKFEVHLR